MRKHKIAALGIETGDNALEFYKANTVCSAMVYPQ